MRAAPPGDAGQGDGVSGAGLVGASHGPGGTRRALSTPGARATLWRAGLPGLTAGAKVWR
jgi:hypothetical protein